MFSSSSLYLIYLFMYHRSFAKAIGCDINSLKLCAKTKTVQEILVAQLNVSSPPTLLPFGPLVDGYFLPVRLQVIVILFYIIPCKASAEA